MLQINPDVLHDQIGQQAKDYANERDYDDRDDRKYRWLSL